MDKEFVLGKLFDIENKWVYGKNKNWKTRFSTPTKNSIPVISGITVNNGENYYTEDDYVEDECFENCLTISTRGEYSGTVFYHEGKFLLANNILTMPMPNWDKECCLYIATCISKIGYGGYGGYPTKNSLKENVVSLPIKTDENGKPIIDDTCFYHEEGFIPDFNYMHERITELEHERITELEHERITELERYLKVTGLNDYELTKEDIEILSLSGFGHYEKRDSEDVVKVCKEMKDFALSSILDVITPIKRFNANTVEITEYIGHPYVVRSSNNNGIRGYINEDEKYLNDGNTFSFGQDTATIFWQPKAYFTGDKIKVLKPKFDCNDEIANYIMNRIEIAFSGFSWGSQSFKISVIENMMISLPIQTDDNNNPIIDTKCKYHPKGYIPDWDFMEKYIKAIEKIVIADVVKYKDEIITKTKEVVN